MAFSGTRFRLIKEGSRLDKRLTKRYGSSLFTYGQIFAMLVPLILDKVFMYLIDMLTASMVSSSSQESVTAISLVMPLNMIVLCFAFAVASGGTVVIAQYKGMGDSAKLSRAAGQTMLATGVILVALSLPLIIFSGNIVDFLYPAAEQAVRTKAASYMVGFCFSLWPFALYQGAFAVLRGIGNTKDCLKLTVIINSVHLIGSMLFINVLGLDIMGTALSYNVARIIGGVAAVYFIVRKKSGVGLKWRFVFKIEKKMQAAIFRQGIPFAAEQVLFYVGLMVVQTYLVVLGTANVAANANASSIFNMFIGCGEAVATLAITVVGQCMGAGEKEQARIYGKRMMTVGRFALIGGIIVIYPLLNLLFILYDAPAETTSIMFWLITMAVIPLPFFWPYSNIMPSVLRAAGDVDFSSIVSLITMWTVRVGGGYLFAITLGMGVYGIWIMLVGEWLVKGAICYIRFRGKKWLTKKAV